MRIHRRFFGEWRRKSDLIRFDLKSPWTLALMVMMHRHCRCNLHFNKPGKARRMLITFANSINLELPNLITDSLSFICKLIKIVAGVFITVRKVFWQDIDLKLIGKVCTR